MPAACSTFKNQTAHIRIAKGNRIAYIGSIWFQIKFSDCLCFLEGQNLFKAGLQFPVIVFIYPSCIETYIVASLELPPNLVADLVSPKLQERNRSQQLHSDAAIQ